MSLDASMDGFRDHDYRITWRLSLAEQHKVSELRAEVFCRELGWTGSREDRVERDEFDADSTHIAVFDKQSELIGTFRLITSGAPWMLDTVFSELAPPIRIIKGPDTAEASRLAVNRQWRGKPLGNGMSTCDLLYKAAYVYCRLHGIRYLYMVVSDIVFEHMRRAGLPCREISTPRVMPDGVVASTAVIDWNRIRETSGRASWFASGWQIPPTGQPAGRVHPSLMMTHSGQFPLTEAA